MRRADIDRGLANGAIAGGGMEVDPLVDARPTEEMSAVSNHGILRLIKADTAGELNVRISDWTRVLRDFDRCFRFCR